MIGPRNPRGDKPHEGGLQRLHQANCFGFELIELSTKISEDFPPSGKEVPKEGMLSFPSKSRSLKKSLLVISSEKELSVPILLLMELNKAVKRL